MYDFSRLDFLGGFDTAYVVVVDDGLKPFCRKNRFGNNDMFQFDKSEFEIVRMSDIKEDIETLRKKYYRKKIWIMINE